ncbi:sugar phosphate isomerase/epimerase family protein [Thermogemmatispora tikiterensis]|nr:sugar phosphate isomerase/epimerase [Thermogemmatispora tikiterensis]
MKADLKTDIVSAANAGFQYLELWAAQEGLYPSKVDHFLETYSAEDLRRLLDQHDIIPLSFSAIEFIAFRDRQFTQVKERCRQLCELAHIIGCPYISVVASPLPHWTVSWETVVREHVIALQELSLIARPYGLKLAFEFLGFGWCSVRTPRAAQTIVQQTGCDNVGIIFDAVHFYIGGASLGEISELNPELLYLFHLDDVEDTVKEAYTDTIRLLPGQGVIPLADICTRLKEIGYDGPCSVELFRPEYWALDPLQMARQAREAAVQVLSPYFALEGSS